MLRHEDMFRDEDLAAAGGPLVAEWRDAADPNAEVADWDRLAAQVDGGAPPFALSTPWIESWRATAGAAAERMVVRTRSAAEGASSAQTRSAQTQSAQTRSAQTRSAQTRSAQTQNPQTRSAQTLRDTSGSDVAPGDAGSSDPALSDAVPSDAASGVAAPGAQVYRALGYWRFTTVARRRGALRVAQAILHGVGDPEWDVICPELNGLLVAPGAETAAWAAALDALCARPDWDEIMLPGIAADLEARLRPLAEARGLLPQRRGEAASAAVDLAALRAAGAVSLEGYVARLGRSTRGQIRRSLKRYGAIGPLTLEAATAAEHAWAWLEEAAPHHRARWGRAALDYPGFAAHHRRVIERHWRRGEVDLLRARAGATPFAWLYNFREPAVGGDRIRFYVGALVYGDDPHLKPGLVAHALAIVRAAHEGAAVYDFLGGAARYKTSLGAPGPEIVTLALQRRRPHLLAERAGQAAMGGMRALRRRIVDRTP